MEPAAAHSESDLSEEEVASLAAQLAEAKHEESQAVAPADAVAAIHSTWPDLIVGLGILTLNADAAREVWSAAREEHRQADV